MQTNYFLWYSISDALLKLSKKHPKKNLTMREMLLNFNKEKKLHL